MDRLACVDLPALPLQVLLRRETAWRALPAAVISREAPQGQVLHLNAPARRAGLSPGLGYAAALGFCPALRAAAVEPAELREAVAALCEALRSFSPHVEPHPDLPGTFWLDASGLRHLAPSLHAWAQAIRGGLAQRGFQAAVAVGFSRFGTLAVARALHGERAWVFDDREREQRALQRVPLGELALSQDARAALGDLGVHTLGALMALPGAGLRRRLGPEVFRLHQQAHGALDAPVQPRPAPAPLCVQLDFEPPERDRERLTFRLKRALDGLLTQLDHRGLALSSLTMALQLDRSPPQSISLRPAAPTLDPVKLLGLVKLRLEALVLGAGVVSLRLEVAAAQVARAQLGLFAQKPRRNLDAAAQAFARLRASYGDDAVVTAHLREGHLPEACFAWVPLHTLPEARPVGGSPPSLVRTFATRPAPLPQRILRAAALHGPFRISGGWWLREVVRDYHFIECEGGAIAWAYFDGVRKRWFLQGEVR